MGNASRDVFPTSLSLPMSSSPVPAVASVPAPIKTGSDPTALRLAGSTTYDREENGYNLEWENASELIELLVRQDGSATNTNIDHGAYASLISAAKDMIHLMEELISRAPQDPGIAKSYTKSVNLMRSQLSALLLSAMADDDGSRLPEKENLSPNQLSWPETATQMGVKRGGHKRQGKVDSALTSQHLSEPNRMRAADNDPYGAGEQSGKHAKPDAHSAAANA